MLYNIWLYSLISVLLISLISFIGLFSFVVKSATFNKLLLYFVSFSTGALFGDAFLHILPEATKKQGFTLSISLFLLFGILIFFILEKFIHWRHCHRPVTNEHVHAFAYMNLVGDGLHNFIDGMIIAASYIASLPLGIATTLAVAFHEIPQEAGEFCVLIRGGFTKKRALVFNFLFGLLAVLGAVVAIVISGPMNNLSDILLPIAAGGFIYIAGSDLIPELHKENQTLESVLELASFILGIVLMIVLLLIR